MTKNTAPPHTTPDWLGVRPEVRADRRRAASIARRKLRGEQRRANRHRVANNRRAGAHVPCKPGVHAP